MEAFGNNLKYLRTQKNLTQKELGLILKQGATTILEWEKGRNQPPLEILIQIAVFFDVSTDFLLGLENKQEVNIEN